MKVVVEVEVQMAKGDAEMKSSKVDIKAKLSVWSGIALMALALSSGKPVLAAEDIKLWHKENNERLIHLEDKDEAKSEAVEFILGKGETKADLEKFAKKFSKEPVQFLEGIKAAWTKVDKEDTSEKKDKVKEFKDKFIKDLEKVDSKAFGVDGTKEVFLDLVKKLFERKIDSESAIAELLANPLVQTALNITGKEPEVAAKSDTDKTDKTKPAPSTKEEPKVEPKPVVGEVGNDAQDRAMAQQVCDAIKGRESGFAQKEAELQKLMDAANQLLNSKASESSINPAALQNKKNEKGLEEILPSLLANALGQQEQQEEVAPAPNNTQPFVPSNRTERGSDPSAFNQPLPLQNQQNNAPFFLPPNTNPGIATPVRLDLPSSSGQQELRDAQAISAVNEGRAPISAQLGAFATPLDLMAARVKVKTDIQKTQIALTNAKDRAAKLDEQLEELKEGGRAALAPEVKKQQAQLQNDVDTAKRNYDQQRQMLMMVAPEQRAELQNMLMTLQQDLNFKEQKLNQFNANVDVAVEDGNRQIKKLAKVRDMLNSEVSKLNSQLAGMREDEQAVAQLVNQNQQLQMAQLQGQGGVQNVNNGARLQGFTGSNGGPRTLSPSRLGGAFGNRAATPANGNAVRGPLTR
ncbi:MAG: hypothetical protein EBR01_03160 [Proteobacteria bacterium]|nr:hypothetical protein [Pseudomonadota bacterium]